MAWERIMTRQRIPGAWRNQSQSANFLNALRPFSAATGGSWNKGGSKGAATGGETSSEKVRKQMLDALAVKGDNFNSAEIEENLKTSAAEYNKRMQRRRGEENQALKVRLDLKRLAWGALPESMQRHAESQANEL